MSRNRRRRSRLGRVVAALATTALVGAAVPAGAGASFDRLTAADWRGSGEAGGITRLELPNGQVDINGRFEMDLEFTVRLIDEQSGLVADGSWELTDGLTFWRILSGGAEVGEGAMLHAASGFIFGTSEELFTGPANITSTGTVSIQNVGDIAVDSTDVLNDLQLEVTRQLCNDAYGEWIFSWNTQLRGEGLTPTFDGNWHALRLPPTNDEEARAELEESVIGLFELRQSVGELMQQPAQFGVPVVPYDEIWGVVERAVRLINILNNLNPCEQAFFGSDNIADYVNALTNVVQLMINVLLDNYALHGEQISGRDLLELATLAGSVGAIGSGAADQDPAAFTRERLRQEAVRAAGPDNPDPTDRNFGEAARITLGGGP